MEKERLISLGLTLLKVWVLSPKRVLTGGSLRNPRGSEILRPDGSAEKKPAINVPLGPHRRIFRGPLVTLFRDRRIRRQPWAIRWPSSLGKPLRSYMGTSMGTGRGRPSISGRQTLVARGVRRPALLRVRYITTPPSNERTFIAGVARPKPQTHGRPRRRAMHPQQEHVRLVS